MLIDNLVYPFSFSHKLFDDDGDRGKQILSLFEKIRNKVEFVLNPPIGGEMFRSSKMCWIKKETKL